MKDIADYLVEPSCPLREAIRVMDQAGGQIALVVEHDSLLIGTVTDGDVRRGLLRGETLDSPVEKIMFRNFRALPENSNRADALRMMRNECIHQIPAVDVNGRVVQLYLLDDLLDSKVLPNPVIIMAGGKGNRLRPLTEFCPKPMLSVGGKPLLEIILDQCIDAGFHEFYFAVNYLKQQIQDYFQDGARWHIKIEYLEEQQPLGTAGALSLLPVQPNAPMLVLNGDVLTRVDYASLLRFHSESEAKATLCVREHATQIPYGVVRLDDLRVLTLEEKPVISHYVNAGIYLLDPDLLALVPNDHYFDMPHLLEMAVQSEHRVSAFPIHEYWLDVGLPETLERANGEWF